MDDRLAATEAALRARLRRDLGRVPVAPYARYRTAAVARSGSHQQPLRAAAALAASIAVLVLAVFAGGVLNDARRSAPAPEPGAAASSSPSPMPRVPTPAPIPTPAVPTCASGQLPVLDVAFPPPPGSVPGTGAATAEAAFREANPAITTFTMYPLGSDRAATSVSELGQGPVWIVAGDQTFVAHIIGDAQGTNNWFAYPAKFLGCREPSPSPIRTLPPAQPPECPASGPTATVPRLLPTNPGPIATRVARDDAWTRPALVPPQFLILFSPSEIAYQQIVCHSVYVYGYGSSEGSKLMLALAPYPQRWPAVDSTKPATLDNPMPGLGLQLWLMDAHFLGMTADARGVVTVQLQRRPGFEWVVFDLEAVAVSPHPSGSLLFRFVDATGQETLSPIVRIVGASWEYGRAPAP